MRTYDEPDRNRRTGGGPHRTIRSAEPVTQMDLRGQSQAALLALQRAIGNAAVSRLVADPGDRFEQEAETTARAASRGPVPATPHAQRAVTKPAALKFGVQRLKVHGGAPVRLADQTDPFLLDLVRTIDTDPGAKTYTYDGVTYDVGSEDLATAKTLLAERQQKLSKTYATYDDYAKSQKRWKEKREKKPIAALSTGSYLYHGTSKEVALIAKDSGLTPAQPSFRGDKWDASRDGFLSMTSDPATVTVKPKSIILRMKVEDGDLATWKWKDVGGDSEVVSMKEVPEDRLEWSTDKKTWQPMSNLT